MQNYNSTYMSSKELFSKAESLFPGAVNSPLRFYPPYPRFIKSGSGARITDEDGRSYIDYCLAFGPMIYGHSNKKIVDKVKVQLDLGMSFGAPGRGEVQLGERISDAIPSIEMMRFTNSGTEATMHAIRLARFFTGRKLILKVEGGFHGSHDYALSTVNPEQLSSPDETATIEVPFNDVSALVEIFRKYGKHLAAFILEPVMGNIGVIPPNGDYLAEARKLTEEYGTLLIFDEVITGFRSSYGAYQDIAGVRPDLTTLGKIIGGGMPVGVFGGREDIMKNVAPLGKFYQQGTFSGNPVTMAAGIAGLDFLKESDYSVPVDYSARLSKYIETTFKSYGHPVNVNQVGTMFTVFFNSNKVKDNDSAMKSDTEMFTRFFETLLEKGIFVARSQFEACFMSFAHTESEISQTESVIKETAEILSQ